jgi:hypothetical protein
MKFLSLAYLSLIYAEYFGFECRQGRERPAIYVGVKLWEIFFF